MGGGEVFHEKNFNAAQVLVYELIIIFSTIEYTLTLIEKKLPELEKCYNCQKYGFNPYRLIFIGLEVNFEHFCVYVHVAPCGKNCLSQRSLPQKRMRQFA